MSHPFGGSHDVQNWWGLGTRREKLISWFGSSCSIVTYVGTHHIFWSISRTYKRLKGVQKVGALDLSATNTLHVLDENGEEWYEWRGQNLYRKNLSVAPSASATSHAGFGTGDVSRKLMAYSCSILPFVMTPEPVQVLLAQQYSNLWIPFGTKNKARLFQSQWDLKRYHLPSVCKTWKFVLSLPRRNKNSFPQVTIQSSSVIVAMLISG